MNEKEAKTLRRSLLPGVKQQTGASRGRVIRALTKYGTVRMNPAKANESLIVDPECPRGVIQRVKKEMRRGGR